MARGNAKKPYERKTYGNERNLTFSQNVRTRRLELNLKQAQLGEKAGMTTKQISELEGGRHLHTGQFLLVAAIHDVGYHAATIMASFADSIDEGMDAYKGGIEISVRYNSIATVQI